MRVTDPATLEVLADLETDTAVTLDAKLAHAREGGRRWAKRPWSERAEALARFSELLVRDQASLALTTTREMGKPIRQATNELNGLAPRIDFFLNHTADVLSGETVFREADGSLTERIEHEPLGVVSNISAWNYPYFVGANVFVPALLCGNAVLYKPSEYASMTGLAVTKLLYEAGVPEDVFLPVVGASDVGQMLLERRTDGVFFTGSYATGKKVAQAAASHLARVQLELGGKDPAYVCEDVDVSKAAEALADGAFYNTGQSCCAVERIYVHERVYDQFVSDFVRTVNGFVMGDPQDPNTYIGPLAREPQLDVLAAQVADAEAQGAQVRLGGKRADRKGNYFEPTVVLGAAGSMRVMREESFGPIIGIERVSNDEQALARMMDTPYGLTAAVYTTDTARAEAILRELPVGSAYVNCCDRVSPRLPWSGRGHSGLGCTLSRYGILAFTQPKAFHIRSA